MKTARTQTGLLFDIDEPAPHAPVARRTGAEREANLNQILYELRRCEAGVTYLRLAEITREWRGDIEELKRRGHEFYVTEINPRFGVVHLVD